jgi:hypothetical protein
VKNENTQQVRFFQQIQLTNRRLDGPLSPPDGTSWSWSIFEGNFKIIMAIIADLQPHPHFSINKAESVLSHIVVAKFSITSREIF